MPEDIPAAIRSMAEAARVASRGLANLGTDEKNRILIAIADGLEARALEILAANQLDLEAGEKAGLAPAMMDRLRLTKERISASAKDVRHVAGLPDPVGKALDEFNGAQGILIRKVSVPIGVIAILFESRPNVTIDAAALCLKSGNATILRGGKEALHSNLALARVLQESGQTAGLPANAVQLVPFTDRSSVPALVGLDGLIDLAIPRGGHGLIEAVVSHARVPVIKHYDGICHLYLDSAADAGMAAAIAVNAKCQRPGVCNAAESLLIHADAAERLLPVVGRALLENGVELRGDADSLALLESCGINAVAAKEEDFRTEFLALIMAVKIVPSLEEAIAHINSHGSHHSDAIITGDETAARRFLAEVDSAAVYWNASTRFTDGGQFGFGAEIGISTDKLHARGPMGLPELTSYKYLVTGNGQTRA
ncbi:MAG: glutamate-5-semialdehyde dehydrogenase [Verrucomicrobiales bacterium]